MIMIAQFLTPCRTAPNSRVMLCLRSPTPCAPVLCFYTLHLLSTPRTSELAKNQVRMPACRRISSVLSAGPPLTVVVQKSSGTAWSP